MPIGYLLALAQDWVMSNLIPVDILEVLLTQNSEQKSSHIIITVGGHDGSALLAQLLDRRRTNGIQRWRAPSIRSAQLSVRQLETALELKYSLNGRSWNVMGESRTEEL